MYQKYFKLAEMPFNINPDPRFLYMSPQHQDAIEKCQYVVKEQGGLVVIYGAIGMGKTTIARHLYSLFRDMPGYQVAQLITPTLRTGNAFLRAIMDEFDLPQKRSHDKNLKAFQEFIVESYQHDQNLVLIVDEAQKLTPNMLEVLHDLLNFESNTQKFLQIVLIGQNELAEHIDKALPIKSRVAMFGDLQNLGPDETNEMIAFRWHIASNAKSSHPFTDDALDSIYLYSHGLPREINKLCNDSLLRAAGEGATEVTNQHVVESAKTLRLKQREEK